MLASIRKNLTQTTSCLLAIWSNHVCSKIYWFLFYKCAGTFLFTSSNLFCHIWLFFQFVESVVVCFIKIGEQESHSSVMLDELRKYGLVQQFLPLVHLKSQTTLCQTTYLVSWYFILIWITVWYLLLPLKDPMFSVTNCTINKITCQVGFWFDCCFQGTVWAQYKWCLKGYIIHSWPLIWNAVYFQGGWASQSGWHWDLSTHTRLSHRYDYMLNLINFQVHLFICIQPSIFSPFSIFSHNSPT